MRCVGSVCTLRERDVPKVREKERERGLGSGMYLKRERERAYVP